MLPPVEVKKRVLARSRQREQLLRHNKGVLTTLHTIGLSDGYPAGSTVVTSTFPRAPPKVLRHKPIRIINLRSHVFL